MLKRVLRRVVVARLALATSGGSSLRYIIYESSSPVRPSSSTVNDALFYVQRAQRVPSSRVSIGGYHDISQHRLGDQVWIQSVKCDGADIRYQLRNPALPILPST